MLQFVTGMVTGIISYHMACGFWKEVGGGREGCGGMIRYLHHTGTYDSSSYFWLGEVPEVGLGCAMVVPVLGLGFGLGYGADPRWTDGREKQEFGAGIAVESFVLGGYHTISARL